MVSKLLTALTMMATLAVVAPAIGQAQFGTAAEAKAMLEKAVTALKADKASTCGLPGRY